MQPFLQFQQVDYSYPNQNEYALHNLSFSAHRGEFLGILGADEAGKTTLAKLTNGLIRPSSGHITFTDPEGRDISLDSDRVLKHVRKHIGVVFADPENLRVPPKEMRERVDHVLKQVGLSHYATRSPHQLSGGEQQKLCIAGVLVMEPECLVLDEPVTFLDHASRKEILELLRALKNEGKTILYLTSDPEELMYADRVLVLHKGTVFSEGSVSMIWNHPDILAQISIVPSDMLIFRQQLQQQGYFMRDDSLTPEAVIADICGNT